MSKINAFTLKDPDVCVRCGKDMQAGEEVSWLRNPVSKGYFHTLCEAKPVQEHLLKIRVPAADSPLGYVWARPGAIPDGTEGQDRESYSDTQDRDSYVPDPNLKPLKTIPGADAPLPGPWEQKPAPQVNADGILLNALAQALLPKLSAQIAEAVAKGQPRIVVNVYVPKPGDEAKALDLLSKELFLLNSVQSL